MQFAVRHALAHRELRYAMDSRSVHRQAVDRYVALFIILRRLSICISREQECQFFYAFKLFPCVIGKRDGS